MNRATSIAVACLAALATGTATAQTIRTFPGCSATLQGCVNASASGDTIRIATDVPLTETIDIRHPLTLESAPGSSPSFADSADIFVTAEDPAGGAYVVRGLSFDRGRIYIHQGSTGPLAATVEQNAFTGAEENHAAIEIDDIGDQPLGAVTFSIADNVVIRRPRFAGRTSLGIRVSLDQAAEAAGTITRNVVDISGSDSGFAIDVSNRTPSMRLTVDRNQVTGTDYHGAYELTHDRDDATLSAEVTNNLASGQRGRAGNSSALALTVSRGTLDAVVVNNSFIGNRTTMDLRPGQTALLSGLFANNIVALSEQGIGIFSDVAATFLPRNNLVFGNVIETFPGPGSLLADPRLLADGSHRPGADSPVRDAGATDLLPPDRLLDLAGNPRVAGAAVDIGAFELSCPDGSFGDCLPAPEPAPDPTPDPGPAPDPADPGQPTPDACSAASCDDGDPCTIDECTPAGCVSTERDGFAAALCACQRPEAAACAGDPVPRGVRGKSARACTLLDKASTAAKARQQRRLVRRAATLWTRAARQAASGRSARKLSAGCVTALDQTLADAASRTASLAR